MTLDYARIRKLCTTQEFALVESVHPSKIKRFTSTQLQSKITQARKQADKWREQAISQKRAADRPVDGAGRSAEKQEVFQEVLARLEARLEELTASPATVKQVPTINRSARPGGRVKSSKAKSPNSAGAAAAKSKGKGKSSVESKVSDPKVAGRTSATRAQISGLKNRVRGHVSARGKRTQAKRNAR